MQIKSKQKHNRMYIPKSGFFVQLLYQVKMQISKEGIIANNLRLFSLFHSANH